MPGQDADIIIVGAGSAGCVLARRLSADPDLDVLLIEAGEPTASRTTRIPALFTETWRSDLDWAYTTASQDEMHDRTLYWPRGKTLGGSSAINAMIHVRGHPADFDHWADAGNDGWAYEDVLPYFKRSETYAATAGDQSAHGTSGPLQVTAQRSPRELSETFLEAAAASGYPRNSDFNSGSQAGFGLFHVNQKRGRRHSVADAYLKPVLERPNLTTLTGANVHRVLFDDGQAVGVTYEHDGGMREAGATEEVILSAGTIDSATLLLRSGVGPADHLDAVDIPTQVNRPGVGRNLQDHLFVPLVYETTTTATLDGADSLWNLPLNLARFYLRGRGPLTSNGAEAGGFLRTDSSLPAPDLEVLFIPAFFMNHTADNPTSGHGFTVGPILLDPDSRGRIRLDEDEPYGRPVIDPQYLTESTDVDRLIDGVRRAREIAQATPFDPVRGQELWPGTEVRTDEELATSIRERGHSLYHPVGTCKMGTDELAVVDDRLRVRGVDGLRVVDASIMPRIVAGHTNAATVMIAERAAGWIMAS